MTNYKTCTKCHKTKDISLFPTYVQKDGTIGYRVRCNDCTSVWKEYYEKNKVKLLDYQKTYYQGNREDKLEYASEYRNDPNNQEKIAEYNKEYREENAETLSQYMQEYQLENKNRLNDHRRLRKKNDISFKLRTSVSSYISTQLRKSGSSKNGASCMDYLPFSIEKLREHLEKQFEPWMSWNNYGSYSKGTWNDNDPSTWTWNIDHIIPRSDLLYDNMEDDNFKKCWELSNLRPLSAKQNMIDGTTRARHGKSNKRS